MHSMLPRSTQHTCANTQCYKCTSAPKPQAVDGQRRPARHGPHGRVHAHAGVGRPHQPAHVEPPQVPQPHVAPSAKHQQRGQLGVVHPGGSTAGPRPRRRASRGAVWQQPPLLVLAVKHADVVVKQRQASRAAVRKHLWYTWLPPWYGTVSCTVLCTRSYRMVRHASHVKARRPKEVERGSVPPGRSPRLAPGHGGQIQAAAVAARACQVASPHHAQQVWLVLVALGGRCKRDVVKTRGRWDPRRGHRGPGEWGLDAQALGGGGHPAQLQGPEVAEEGATGPTPAKHKYPETKSVLDSI